MLKGFLKLVEYEMKLFIREPIAAFFTLVFPVFFLVLSMEIFFPHPIIEVSTSQGVYKVKTVDYLLPNFMLMVVATTALMTLPLTVVGYREIRFLKRLRSTPLSPTAIFAGLGAAVFIQTLCGMVLLVLTAFAVYDASFDGNAALFLLSFVLSYLAISGLSFGLLGTMIRTARTAGAIGQIALLPFVYFSGMVIPMERLPGWLRPLSELIPMTHAVRLMQGMWLGQPPLGFLKEIVVLSLLLFVGVALAVRQFRWE